MTLLDAATRAALTSQSGGTFSGVSDNTLSESDCNSNDESYVASRVSRCDLSVASQSCALGRLRRLDIVLPVRTIQGELETSAVDPRASPVPGFEASLLQPPFSGGGGGTSVGARRNRSLWIREYQRTRWHRFCNNGSSAQTTEPFRQRGE